MKDHKPRKPAPHASGAVAGPDDLMTPREAALLLGVDERTLANWRSLGKGPRFFKPTRKQVFYSRQTVLAFLTRIEVQSAREARSKHLGLGKAP